MATITITVVETGFPNATKIFTFTPDTELDRMIASYQQEANTSINGTATRAQVLNYWAETILKSSTEHTTAYEKQKIATDSVKDHTPIKPV